MARRHAGRAIMIGFVSLLCGLTGCRSEKASPPDPLAACPDCNVLLISLDTLRADHLGCYGYERPTSPAIDELAKDSILFEKTINTGGGTLPVHMSMMTSLPPSVHDIWPRRRRRLPDERVTLAEQLRSDGYETGAFTDRGWMLARFGFDQGFDVYDDRGGGFATILPKGLAWLEKNRSKKFFLFLHTYDIHSARRRLPYDSPGAYNERYTAGYEGDFTGCVGQACASRLLENWNRQLAMGHRKPEDLLSREDLDFIVGLYDGGINYVDDQIRDLLGKLREMELFDKTVIVILSDHGEEFLEHGRLLHRQNYEEIAHVPWLIRIPGSPLRGRRVSFLTSTLDVMPTILEAVGVSPHPQVRGRNLWPMLERNERAELPVRIAGGREKLRDSKWSLLVEPKEQPAELYDLKDDPREAKNVLDRFPEVAGRLFAELRTIRETEARFKADLDAEVIPERADLSVDERERLESLGYLGR